jgi:KipI family sensor histidine kinase inhibitor
VASRGGSWLAAGGWFWIAHSALRILHSGILHSGILHSALCILHFMSPRLLPAGDSALVVEYGDRIDPALNRRVRELLLATEQAAIPGVVDLVPTYRSLLVCYDPLTVSLEDLQDRLLELDTRRGELSLGPPHVIEIPTVYGGEFGPDLGFVASHNQLTEREVVEIHASADYLVYMMGFSPGFTYLGGMSGRIAAPRLKTPRTAIPAGSVGIAQQQTGIYPVESPGGWQLIGRTPVRLFDPTRRPPVLVEAGDYLRFVPIDAAAYAGLDEAARRGAWAPARREKRDA